MSEVIPHWDKKMRFFNTLTLVCFLAVTVTLLIKSLGLGSSTAKSTLNLPTYFKYSVEEMESLAPYSTQSSFTKESIDKWGEIIYALVEKNQLPPTTASKFYASYYMAQKEAAFLSYNTKGHLAGNVAHVSVEIICEFFPNDCQTYKGVVSNDEYSQTLATLVTSKLKERKALEAKSTTKYFIPQGEQYWDGENPTTPDAGSWKTWFLNSVSEFRGIEPPIYNSDEDLAEVEKVKQAVEKATDLQKIAINYWAGGKGTVTPAGIWFKVFDEEAKDLKVAEFLDKKALLAGSLADAFIVCWHNKFIFNTKRPNMRDSTIKSIIPTPNFPSYPSGHSTVSSTAAQLLSVFFPNRADSFIAMAQEARDSRLWSGIHFPVDNEEGFRLGEVVGQTILVSLP